MSVRLQMLVQCDVCGRELDEKYPPEVIRHDLSFDQDIVGLRGSALALMKAKGWAHNSSTAKIRHDAWGYPIRTRCAQCRQERRWE